MPSQAISDRLRRLFPTAATLTGVDVSHYQGVIDWKTVLGGAVAFVFCKATDGAGVDPFFRSNWHQLSTLAIRKGAYHFLRPGRDSTTQANSFCDVVGELSADDLSPVVDVEWAPTSSKAGAPDAWDSVPAAERVGRVRDFVSRVQQRLGRQPIVYTAPAFWSRKLANDAAFAKGPLWISDFRAHPQPELCGGWPQWTFWQRNEHGSMTGIRGDVDVDLFNGNVDAFLAL